MTKLSENDNQLRAWSFGCPHWADPGEEFTEQLRLANDLWNKLVEITRAHDEAKEAIWRTDPAVATAMAAIDDAVLAVDAVREEMRAARVTDRSTIPRREQAERLDAARAALREARAALSAERARARPPLKEAFSSALKDRSAAIKATYADYSQGRGLGWGTYNDIVRRRFPAAVRSLAENRAAGMPPKPLHFRRFDGQGTLTIQVMTQAGEPARTIPALNSGAHPRSGVFRLTPWQNPESASRPRGSQRHGSLAVTIRHRHAKGPLRLELPVVMHQWLPADADVSEVKISRVRTGSQYRLRVAVIGSIPAPDARTAGATIAVRPLWHSAGEGWLRVARIGSTGPLPPLPASLKGVARLTGPESAEVLYPAEWRHLLSRDAAIRSVRDQNLNALRDQVAAALKEDGDLAASLEFTAGDVARWRAPRRFATLAQAWPAGHPLAAVLRDWQKRDRHLWDYEAHESAQVLARRRDAYRCVAAWLCDEASTIVLHDLDLAALRSAPGVDREDPERGRKGRAQAQEAAPGELRAAIRVAAEARGVTVILAKEDRSPQ